jgi:hypothetical protein
MQCARQMVSSGKVVYSILLVTSDHLPRTLRYLFSRNLQILPSNQYILQSYRANKEIKIAYELQCFSVVGFETFHYSDKMLYSSKTMRH